MSGVQIPYRPPFSACSSGYCVDNEARNGSWNLVSIRRNRFRRHQWRYFILKVQARHPLPRHCHTMMCERWDHRPRATEKSVDDKNCQRDPETCAGNQGRCKPSATWDADDPGLNRGHGTDDPEGHSLDRLCQHGASSTCLDNAADGAGLRCLIATCQSRLNTVRSLCIQMVDKCLTGLRRMVGGEGLEPPTLSV